MVSIGSDSISSRQTAILVSIVTATAAVLVTYVYQKSRKRRIPKEWTPVGKVAKLCIYPLKSGRRIEVQEAECTQQGLEEVEKDDGSFRLKDRSFVVYNATNLEHRTARTFPKLMLIELRARDTDTVVISAPSKNPLMLKVPSKADHEVVSIRHFDREDIKSIDCGDEAAVWISQLILEKDSGLRLAYHDSSFKRTQINVIHKAAIDFYGRGLRNESAGLNTDLAAMHIINKASALDCIQKTGDSHITYNQFRPTLLVDGPEPFDEDNWDWIKVGEVVMKNVVPCFRCILITVDPETGTRRTDREPLKTLEKYRVQKGPSKSPIMGIYLEVFKTGKISVGDTLYVSKS